MASSNSSSQNTPTTPQTPTAPRPNARPSLNVSQFGITLPEFDLTNSSLGTLHDLLKTRAALAYDLCSSTPQGSLQFRDWAQEMLALCKNPTTPQGSHQVGDWAHEMSTLASVCEEWQEQMVERREVLRKMGAPLSFAVWLDRRGRP
ncbi:MAG: hypothetical protein Q9221_003239 [Calogaya cf. arnoldii]